MYLFLDWYTFVSLLLLFIIFYWILFSLTTCLPPGSCLFAWQCRPSTRVIMKSELEEERKSSQRWKGKERRVRGDGNHSWSGVPEGEIESFRKRELGLERGNTEGRSLEENNKGMISISCRFFRFHTVPLCFQCILGFCFDAWMWELETFAYSYRIWVCLHAFYTWFLTYFLGSILRFHMRCLQSCLDFYLKSILAHSSISKPVDWNMKHGFY